MNRLPPEPLPEDESLLAELRALPPILPNDDLEKRFRIALVGQSRPRNFRWQLRAAILLVSCGGGVWWWSQSARTTPATAMAEFRALPEIDRLSRLAQPDSAPLPQNVATLDQLLRNEQSPTVRVGIVRALATRLEDAKLAAVYRELMSHETSPFVQAAVLLRVAHLSTAKRNEVVQPLRSRADIDPTIRLAAGTVAP